MIYISEVCFISRMYGSAFLNNIDTSFVSVSFGESVGLDPGDYIQRERKAGRRQVDIFAHVGLGDRGYSVSNVSNVVSIICCKVKEWIDMQLLLLAVQAQLPCTIEKRGVLVSPGLAYISGNDKVKSTGFIITLSLPFYAAAATCCGAKPQNAVLLGLSKTESALLFLIVPNWYHKKLVNYYRLSTGTPKKFSYLQINHKNSADL
jgi:hypothetical protein